MRRVLAWLLDGLLSIGLFLARLATGARQRLHTTDDGVQVRWLRIARPGRPVAVLIHGFSDRPESFLRTAAALRDYDVILPALPGFHEPRQPGIRYNAHTYARWVASLLDAQGITGAHVCGNSLGGATGLVLASERPDLVSSLVPLDTGGVEVPGVPSIHDEVRGGHNLFLVRSSSEVSVFLERIFHRPPAVLRAASGVVALELSRKAEGYAAIMHDLIEEGEALESQGAVVPLEALSVPTLVAWGEHDTLFPLAVGEAVAERIPGARLHVFAQTGHCPHIERPTDLARVCARFWSGLQSEPTEAASGRLAAAPKSDETEQAEQHGQA